MVRLLSGLVGLVVLFGHPVCSAQESEARQQRRALRQEQRQMATADLAGIAISPDREVVALAVDIGEKVSEQEMVLDNIRSQRLDVLRAVENLRVLATGDAIRVLSDHVDRYVVATNGREDGTYDEFPCAVALSRIGWASVPFLLSRLERQGGGSQERVVAWTLGQVLGNSLALKILEHELALAGNVGHRSRISDAMSLL